MDEVKIIYRHNFADYLNVGNSEKADWALMGTGFTALDEEFGAQSESTKYVNQAAASSDVVAYETTFPFTAHMIPSEKAIDKLYRVGRDHKLGADARLEYVRVELWDKKEGDSTFAARKFIVSANVTGVSGENRQEMTGNLNAVGDPIEGTFDTKTLTFTEAQPSEAV